jgi:GNAT superfamily N-acetyltransferase
MDASLCIVPAAIEDAAEIARLSFELGYPKTTEQTRAALERMLMSPAYFVVVAKAGGGARLGWIAVERRLSLESGESAEITGLVVAATARRMGVGKALVDAAEQWARNAGFDAIRVRSNVTRTESHPFYREIGFRQSKTQHVYIKRIVSDAA